MLFNKNPIKIIDWSPGKISAPTSNWYLNKLCDLNSANSLFTRPNERNIYVTCMGDVIKFILYK
jgi:hypothetical protein